MNFAATTSCPPKSPVRSSVASALHPLFAPRSPQTPSLPDARPGSDRFRCGGRGRIFFAVGDFQKQLKAFGMLGSMSRKGDCWDNAVTETLFGSLKVERLHGMRFGTRRAAKDEVMDWLQFYNHRRLHSTLGYLSPMNFEKAKANERKGLGEEERKAA